MKQRKPQLAKRQGIIFILSAPSGAGKTTLYNGLKKIIRIFNFRYPVQHAAGAAVRCRDETIVS